MQKVIKDGKVAILVSPGFGAGWSTWMDGETKERATFCPALVNALLAHASYTDVLEIAEREFPKEYLGGLGDLKVMWLPEGEQFYIHEYDGSESLETSDILCYTA